MYRPNSDIAYPAVCDTSHIISKVTGKIMTPKKEYAALCRLQGCPVNRRVKTSMSKASFVRSCLIFQKKAGVQSRKEKEQQGEKTPVYSSSTVSGFKSNNIHNCWGCEIGSRVRGNKEFDPPYGITFVDLVQQVTKKKRRGIRKRDAHKSKLSIEQVLEIRDRHSKGETISSLARSFAPIGKSTISDVVNRKTWKFV